MMTASQIITQAMQIARVPANSGYSVQAGLLLNQILTSLTQEYDLAVALGSGSVTVTPSGPSEAVPSTGPYSLPSDFLRMASRDVRYLINQIPYVLTQVTLAQFDAFINQIGVSSYPRYYATDVSSSPPSFFVYPPPILQFDVLFHYYHAMPEIVQPETSAVVPWFPNQNYLLARLAGELMRITGDPRADSFLGDGPSGAIGILRRWLNLQGDKEDTAKVALLDPRWFGRGSRGLPPSRITGGL
jgi:hypothetical protein